MSQSVKNATNAGRQSPFVRAELSDVPTLSSAIKKRFNLRQLKKVPDVGGTKDEFKPQSSPSRAKLSIARSSLRGDEEAEEAQKVLQQRKEDHQRSNKNLRFKRKSSLTKATRGSIYSPGGSPIKIRNGLDSPLKPGKTYDRTMKFDPSSTMLHDSSQIRSNNSTNR